MSEKLTLEQQATNYTTMRHIERVRDLLGMFIMRLLVRGEEHDQSKMKSPEVEAFTEFTPKLAASTYGSPEYESYRAAMKPALDHHYANNRHHPEHWPGVDDSEVARVQEVLDLAREYCGRHSPVVTYLEEQLAIAKSPIGNMTLVDLLEMLADWKAASERHNDGNIRKSIEVNTARFKMSYQLALIFENTAKEHF